MKRILVFLFITLTTLIVSSCKKDEVQAPPKPEQHGSTCSSFQVEFQVEMFNQDPSIDRNSVAMEVDLNGVKKVIYLCLEPTHLFNRITLKETWTFNSSNTANFVVNYRITKKPDYCGNGATYYNFETDIGEFSINCENTSVIHKVIIPLIQ